MDSTDIEKLANLAHLHIDETTADEVARNITNVLQLVDTLTQADTRNIEPMAHPLDALQYLRPDSVTEGDIREAAQAHAPATRNGLYLVPKVIE